MRPWDLLMIPGWRHLSNRWPRPFWTATQSIVLSILRETLPLDFSLTKADRILKRREFIALSETGQRIQNRQFIAVFAPNRHGRSRIGITVTKKVGPAVKRNRIKRLVREYFRLNRHKLTGNWDINLIAKRQIADISSEQTYRSLQNIFERILSHEGRW